MSEPERVMGSETADPTPEETFPTNDFSTHYPKLPDSRLCRDLAAFLEKRYTGFHLSDWLKTLTEDLLDELVDVTTRAASGSGDQENFDIAGSVVMVIAGEEARQFELSEEALYPRWDRLLSAVLAERRRRCGLGAPSPISIDPSVPMPGIK